MKLPGYCLDCRRIKQVRVSNAGMVRVGAGQTPVGRCGCVEAKREAARRHPSTR